MRNSKIMCEVLISRIRLLVQGLIPYYLDELLWIFTKWKFKSKDTFITMCKKFFWKLIHVENGRVVGNIFQMNENTHRSWKDVFQKVCLYINGYIMKLYNPNGTGAMFKGCKPKIKGALEYINRVKSGHFI